MICTGTGATSWGTPGLACPHEFTVCVEVINYLHGGRTSVRLKVTREILLAFRRRTLLQSYQMRAYQVRAFMSNPRI